MMGVFPDHLRDIHPFGSNYSSAEPRRLQTTLTGLTNSVDSRVLVRASMHRGAVITALELMGLTPLCKG